MEEMDEESRRMESSGAEEKNGGLGWIWFSRGKKRGRGG